MPAFGINFESSLLQKQEVCKRCIRTKTFVRKVFDFNQIELADFIEDSVMLQIDDWLLSLEITNI